MMLKRSTRQSEPKPQSRSVSARLVRASLAGLAAVTAVAVLATGCLDRKVVPAKPTTSNVFVDQIVQSAVDKIDLLFMIDNSVSMADKQEILRAAVPVLLNRLVAPICVDANGVPTGGSSPNCGTNQPEFTPIGDIHIGIVSSSLGAHGGTVCAAPSPGDDPAITHLDDRAHLIGSVRPEVTPALVTWNGSGFLAWDPSGTKNTPVPGEANAATLIGNFSAMVKATGEHGCGYEASLEAWYRFLIDPEPPATVTKVGSATVRMGVDQDVLAQRAAFLRPDSLVAVVMLSDENDCSIRDDGVGWFVGATSHMPKATQACATNPNDPCCRSCAQNESSPPAGCPALGADPVCMGAAANSYNTWDNLHDSLNLRCYNQKQRFGFDLLYDTGRYVNALTNPILALPSDPTKTVTNPLYAVGSSGKPPRDPSLVFLAGIVGVPWQDIATPDSLSSPTALTYLTAPQLSGQGRWTQLLGDAKASPPMLPTDPFMIETTEPRSGMNPNANPALGSPAIVPATSTNPTASAINGHEQNVPDLADLQYACTFKLATPKVCMPGDAACDCSGAKDPLGDLAAVTAANSPLCQPPAGGAPGATQYYAKAYPGARELTVLRDFKDNAIVASICPKVTTPATSDPAQDPNYGYNPAVGAIINRLKDALKGKCLPRQIETDPETGLVECAVIEAEKAGGSADCSCGRPGRKLPDTGIYPAVFRQLEASGTCGNATAQTKCDTTGFCLCEIVQEQGPELAACQRGTASPAGYCYVDGKVDGQADPVSEALLKSCPDNQKRLLRFVDDAASGTKTPAQGAIAFIACLGKAIDVVDGG